MALRHGPRKHSNEIGLASSTTRAVLQKE